MGIMETFKVMIIVQLFFAFCITLMAYAVPDGAKDYLSTFSNVANEIDLEGVGAEVQNSLTRQTNIPIIEVGALVFYSGNIILDLLLNFMFAIPEMLGLLVNGIMLLFNIDSYIFAIVELFAAVVVSVMYIMGLIELLANMRSGQGIM